MAPWRPQLDTLALIETVREILVEYAAYLPLIIRQIFYRLVGAHDYPKTENAYEALGEKLNRARRAGMIPFSAIRDDGFSRRKPFCWASAASMVEAFIGAAQKFTLPRQRGQERQRVFAVEAAGMIPMIENIAEPYGIEVISSGGLDGWFSI